MAATTTAPTKPGTVTGDIMTGKDDEFSSGKTPVLPPILSLLGFKGSRFAKDAKTMVPSSSIASKRWGRF